MVEGLSGMRQRCQTRWSFSLWQVHASTMVKSVTQCMRVKISPCDDNLSVFGGNNGLMRIFIDLELELLQNCFTGKKMPEYDIDTVCRIN